MLSMFNVLSGTEYLAAPKVVVPPASTTLMLTQATHARKLLALAPTGGLAITPPAATGTLDTYTFLIVGTVAGGNLTIDAKAGASGDIFKGLAFQNLLGTGLTTTPTAATTNLLTLNGTTMGGIVGDLIELVDVATNVWNLFILGQYTGVFSSPLSNH